MGPQLLLNLIQCDLEAQKMFFPSHLDPLAAVLTGHIDNPCVDARKSIRHFQESHSAKITE